MSIAYFLEVNTESSDNTELSNQYIKQLGARLPTLPHVTALNIYTPAGGGHDPMLEKEPTPALVIQAQLEGLDCLSRMLDSKEFTDNIELIKSLSPTNASLQQEALKLDTFKAPETTSTADCVSYLVNYQRPAEDEEHFIHYYRDHHPPILLKFPGLLRLELGYPQAWEPVKDIEWANRMLFCEVSFEDVNALNAALSSDIRKELRKDYETFPPFSGQVTHVPMRRYNVL